MRKFSHIVSLGDKCRTTYQIRRHFNFGLPFPFDWWVSTVDGLTTALDDTYDPYQPELLREEILHDRIFQIASFDLSIRFVHEFPREGNSIVKNWRDFIPKARDTFMKRRERLISLNQKGNEILFVRRSSGNDQNFECLFRKLCEVFDLADFADLLINEYTHIDPDWRVIRANIPDRDGYAPGRWMGQDHEWSTLFSELKLKLSNDSLPVFRGVLMHE